MWHLDAEIICFFFMIVIIVDMHKASTSLMLKDKLFNALSFTTTVAIIIDIISTIVLNIPQSFPIWFIGIGMIIYLTVIQLLSLFLYLYARSIIDNSLKVKRETLFFTFLPFCFYILILLSNPYTNCMFSISSTHEYIRGPLFNIVFVLFIGYNIATFTLACMNFNKRERATSIVLLLSPFIVSTGILMQQLLRGSLLAGVVFTLVLLMIYMFLQNRKVNRDNLTGIFNRTAFSTAIAGISSGKEHGAVLALAVDDFKLFNQSFGQQAGDMLLQKIADYLVCMSPSKIAYRYGGDIFAIILKDFNEDDSINIANTIMTKFAKIFYIENTGYSVSVSIGIVDYPHEKRYKTHSLLTSLDFAIYQAKKRGKGQIAFFDETLIGELQRNYEIMNAITRAIEDESFEIYIQPIYNLKDKNFLGGEALLRLNDKYLGWIPPNELIPIAEKTGQVVAITYIVLNQVCAFIKRNQDILKNKIPISVNFSVIQFMQPDMVEKIITIINRHDIPAHLIKIEITEGMIATSFEHIHQAMLQLNEFGIQFSLDDYGQGYSNILYLINLPFTYVKLDKSIIDHIISDRRFVSALIPMLQSLGKHLVAEGVETEEQVEILNELSCDAIQGFYFSRPLPMDAAVKHFKSPFSKI